MLQNYSATFIYAIGIAISFMISLGACTQENTRRSTQENVSTHDFALPIEKAHHMTQWKQKDALKTGIKLGFGGHTQLDATLFTETNGPGIRLEVSEDTIAVFDGKNIWVTPSDTSISRFNVKTWAYFLQAPYKLNDPGTKMEPERSARMNGKDFDTAKMTFDAGTGDTPDDWYILYRDRETNRLAGMAYIVTAGKTVEEANKQPHAIMYDDVKIMDGIPVATTWNFYTWNKDSGLSDRPIGQATLSNLQFVQKGNLFTKPDGAVRIKGTK